MPQEPHPEVATHEEVESAFRVEHTDDEPTHVGEVEPEVSVDEKFDQTDVGGEG